ncbi:MAG: hypothetical protein ACRC6F_07655, partial [Aeromonas sp.]
INPESERATVDQRLVVLRPVGDGMKRFAHDGYLKRDDSDQITGSSISSMHVASIWETTAC